MVLLTWSNYFLPTKISSQLILCWENITKNKISFQPRKPSHKSRREQYGPSIASQQNSSVEFYNKWYSIFYFLVSLIKLKWMDYFIPKAHILTRFRRWKKELKTKQQLNSEGTLDSYIQVLLGSFTLYITKNESGPSLSSDNVQIYYFSESIS